MTPERWQRIDEVFARTVELAPPEREPHVRAVCGEDPELYAEVMALLASDSTAKISLRAVLDDAVAPRMGASTAPDRR